MKVGDAFIFNLALSSDDHIHFVAFAEGTPPSKLVLLNFTSHYPGKCDETCLIKPHEYKQLSHNSVIGYRWARVVEGAAIQELIKSGIGKKLDPIPSNVMRKIIAGVSSSKFTPNKIKDLFKDPTRALSGVMG